MIEALEESEYDNNELINDKMTMVESKLGQIEKLVSFSRECIINMKDEFKKVRIKEKF